MSCPLLDALHKHKDQIDGFQVTYELTKYSVNVEGVKMTSSIVRGERRLRSYSIPEVNVCIIHGQWAVFPNYKDNSADLQYPTAEEALIGAIELLNDEFEKRRQKLEAQMDETGG